MYLVLKNILDKIFSILFIVLLMPFVLFIIIFLKLNKIEKVFFTQDRTGKDGVIFKIYKFRTITNDNHIPKFCNFLRKTGLDELPQLINILKGDMSFVGPRPWILEYSKYYTGEQKKRLKVKPGITGYAQINNNCTILEKINKDIYYVNNFNFILDIKILFKTLLLIFSFKKHEATDLDINNELKILKNNYKKNRVF